ncbi:MULTISPECIES: hypothetical protein [unclassified Clostridium]|uniref:hypothetical protein n=1 Tax=unclassified Clostridium TaxID=2614128 RepID=UPI0013FA719F|nr:MULTISPECIES: hypothetical protein [unclassified Clostridium]NFI51639.1 hypothetical protein [Clostridium botulinum]NFR85787.1 hypothetical protein [Clostridium botulinum]NFR91421.1 hypothetical protein [Clostridium botulinum]NFT99318.1 hypothetical protein [Clostridium botulinum]
MIGTDNVEKDLKAIQQCLQEVMIQLKTSKINKDLAISFLEDAQTQLGYLLIHNRNRDIIEEDVKKYLLSCINGMETGVFTSNKNVHVVNTL